MNRKRFAPLLIAASLIATFAVTAPAQAAVECSPTYMGRLTNLMGAYTKSDDPSCKAVAVRAFYSPPYTSGISVWTLWKTDNTGYYAGVTTSGTTQKSQHTSSR